MSWPRAPVLWALCLSALLHFSVVVALSDMTLPRARVALPPPVDFTLDFEPRSGGTRSSETLRPVEDDPPVLPGGPALSGTLDRREAEGRGGELRALEPGAILFPFRSTITLQDTELNNLAVNQVQRIHTAPERATQEERRATPNANDAVLLASGRSGHAERRDPARHDPRAGAPSSAKPSHASEPMTLLGTSQDADLGAATARRAVAQRAAELSPAQGIAGGRGRVERRAARVVFARPNVDRGAAATPAEQIAEQVRDDADAELLAAKLQRSLVDSSVQRAALVGAGSGGTSFNPSALGESGRGVGARARPYMPGSGTFGALDTSDARYLRWFTQQRTRVQDELEFPRARAIAKDQGTSVYSVTLRRDGALNGRPKLVRSSGFADFDEAAAKAIERALPFAPLPAELAPELPSIALLIPIAFSNPMIE